MSIVLHPKIPHFFLAALSAALFTLSSAPSIRAAVDGSLGSQIESYIKYFTLNYSNKFCLCPGIQLIVKSSDNPF